MIFRWKSHYKAIPLHTIPHTSAQFREDLIAFLVRNYSAKKWRKRKQSLRAIPRNGILIWNPTFSLLYNLKDAGVKKRKQQKSVRSERKSTHIEKHDIAWKLLYGIEIKNKVESYRSNTRTKKLAGRNNSELWRHLWCGRKKRCGVPSLLQSLCFWWEGILNT